MKKRQRQQQNIVRLPRPRAQQAGHRGQHMVMAQHRPFTCPGRAARVHDHGRVLATRRRNRLLAPSAGVSVIQPAVHPVDRQHLQSWPNFNPDNFIQHRPLGLFYDQQRRLSIVQYMAEFPAPVAQIDRHHHRARLQRRQVGDHKLRPVAQIERDAIPLPHAHAHKGRRPFLRLPLQIREAQPLRSKRPRANP